MGVGLGGLGQIGTSAVGGIRVPLLSVPEHPELQVWAFTGVGGVWVRGVCFWGVGPQNLTDCHKDFAPLGCPSLWTPAGAGQMLGKGGTFDWPHSKGVDMSAAWS